MIKKRVWTLVKSDGSLLRYKDSKGRATGSPLIDIEPFSYPILEDEHEGTRCVKAWLVVESTRKRK